MEYSSPYGSESFVSGITIVTERQATDHRKQLRNAEAKMGNLHHKAKIHTVLRSPYELDVQVVRDARAGSVQPEDLEGSDEELLFTDAAERPLFER